MRLVPETGHVNYVYEYCYQTVHDLNYIILLWKQR